MKQITDVISKIYDDLELRETCIPLFLSSPGTGKTSTIKQFAKEREAKLVEVIASTKMPNEVAGMAIPDYDKGKMTCFDYDLFLDLEDGDIIFFDELLNANIMVLNACLTILENRTLLSGKKLPKVMIVAAANPQGATILTPQIKERFIWYNLIPEKESWKEFMFNKYGVTDNIFEALWTLVHSESFNQSSNNYFSQRSVDKAVNMMIKGAPTPYESKLKTILNFIIPNNSGQDIPIGEYVFKKDETMPWLALKKLEYNATNSK